LEPRVRQERTSEPQKHAPRRSYFFFVVFLVVFFVAFLAVFFIAMVNVTSFLE
jgi:cell division protein FtsI/penicillin-binding protein 2